MPAWPIGTAAARLHQDALVWDNHGCLPIRCDESFLPEILRYRAAGVDMVSINVGFGDMPWQRHIEMLAHFRQWLAARPEEFVLARSVADIERAKEQGKLAVAFDIEGAGAIQDQLSLIQLYYDLGVRWMLIAYNQNNPAGGGCHDEDPGLSPFGRRMVEEMARAGMVVCCSHTGYRTTLDAIAHSPVPVILSHSNPRANWDHPRNVPDEILDACAKGGGVVGINGIGIFLGENDCSTEAILRAI
ncbi:MAG: membrane dipeptidase, partial [Alphaproteobacteria bacterium]